MADQLVLDPQSEAPRDSANRRSLWGVVAIVAVIGILVLLFLTLRGCSAIAPASDSSAGGKEIVPVGGLAPLPGAVSVWVAQGTPIDTVLSIAGVSSSSVTDMGGGRFVIAVPLGAEGRTVARLKGVHGVADAGLVFTPRTDASRSRPPSTSRVATPTGY